MTAVMLVLIGFISGAYGIIVGAGGGFIFVPALLYLFHLSPQVAAGTGLTIVLLNSISGVYTYVKQKRIDYKAGLILSIGAFPGTLIGIWISGMISVQSFYLAFAILLMGLGTFLLIKNLPFQNKSTQTEIAATSRFKLKDNKKIVSLLFLTGFLLGTVSSLFGIGGGWLLVPILIYMFRIYPHNATATSIFSLCIYSCIGVVAHFMQGNLDWSTIFWGGLGVIIGAQFGGQLSRRLSGKLIVQMLSIVLISVGVKLLFN